MAGQMKPPADAKRQTRSRASARGRTRPEDAPRILWFEPNGLPNIGTARELPPKVPAGYPAVCYFCPHCSSLALQLAEDFDEGEPADEAEVLAVVTAIVDRLRKEHPEFDPKVMDDVEAKWKGYVLARRGRQ